MTARSGHDTRRFGRFLSNVIGLSPAEAAPLLTAFARGERVIVPAVPSSSDAEADPWGSHYERAGLIAEFGLYSIGEEQAAAHRAANAKVIAERRAKLNENFLAWGAEGLADELAADLSAPIPAARDRLEQFKAEQRKNSSIPTIEERSHGLPEFGPSFDPKPNNPQNHTTTMEAALARLGATPETKKNG